jgi:hypothetical protein
MRSTTAAAETKSRRRANLDRECALYQGGPQGRPDQLSPRAVHVSGATARRAGLEQRDERLQVYEPAELPRDPGTRSPARGDVSQISEAEGLLEQGEQRFVVSAELDHEPRRASWARSEMSLRGRESREEPAKIFRRYVYSARDGLGAAVESA